MKIKIIMCFYYEVTMDFKSQTTRTDIKKTVRLSKQGIPLITAR